MSTVREYEAEQAAEWGRWVAVEPITINGARAFNTGDPVPASHVARGVVAKSSVVGANTETANTETAAAVAEEKI